MKRNLVAIILFVFVYLASAQKVFIAENLTLGKSYKFYVGDRIGVLIKDNPKKYSGKITDITDSAIVISNNYVFNQNEIAAVYKTRLALPIISSALLNFGQIYIILDVVNNLINDTDPIFRKNTVIIASSSAIAGGILALLSTRKCPVEKDKWRVKIIDQIHVKSK